MVRNTLSYIVQTDGIQNSPVNALILEQLVEIDLPLSLILI